MRSVSTLDVRTRLYSSSPGAAGQASVSRPPPQMSALAASPRLEPRFCVPEEKLSRAACASALPTAAYSPQTNNFGNKRSPRTDANQNPLASPSAAESHESRIIGAEIGAASEVLDSISPRKEATRTLPSLIGRNHQRSGISASVRRIVAARSSVRFPQLSSLEQSSALRRICSSVVCAFHM